jgi:hypothetical protein
MNSLTVRAAHLNGDALPDLIAFDDGPQALSVLVATGPAVYAPAAAVPTPFGGYNIAVADVNLDAVPDVLLTAPGSVPNLDFGTFRGDGAGSFLPPILAGTASGTSDIAVGDVQGDGLPDVVALSPLILRRYTGTGTGSFGPAVSITLSSAVVKHVRLADINLDGNLDVLFTGGTTGGFLARMLGDGSGGFGPSVNVSAGANPWAFVTSDFNLDGAADAAIANYTSQSATVLYATGGGSFAPPLTVPTHPLPNDVHAADLDGDGFPDLQTSSSPAAEVRVLANSGGVAFVQGPSYPAYSAAYGIDVADFDVNGTPDVVAALSNVRAVALFLRNAAGVVKVPSHYGVGTSPESIASGDLDRDGFADLVTADSAGNTCTVLLWHGNGAVVQTISLAAPGSPQSTALGDYNGDGVLDAVVTHRSTNELRLRIGDGSGGLADVAGYPVGTKPQSCLALDFNADGALDAAAANSGSGSVSILLGSGAGAFVNNAAYPVGVNTRCVAGGDFNGDGLVDIAAANLTSSSVGFLLGSVAGIPFTTFPPLAVAGDLYWVVAADFNLDGLADLATNRFEKWTGNGSGGFTMTPMPSVGNLVSCVTTDDVNADGLPDVFTANFDYANIGLLTGVPGGGFDNPRLYGAGFGLSSIGTRDLDLDGRPDVYTSNLYGNDVTVSLHLQPPPFGLTAFGTGTGGCFGLLTLLANASPQVGLSTFALTCTNAPARSLGLLLVANAPSLAGFDPFGIGALLHVDPFLSSEFFSLDMLTNSAGTGRAPAPIPNNPVLSGAVYDAQAVFVETAGLTCGPSPVHLVTSKGTMIAVQ